MFSAMSEVQKTALTFAIAGAAVALVVALSPHTFEMQGDLMGYNDFEPTDQLGPQPITETVDCGSVLIRGQRATHASCANGLDTRRTISLVALAAGLAVAALIWMTSVTPRDLAQRTRDRFAAKTPTTRP